MSPWALALVLVLGIDGEDELVLSLQPDQLEGAERVPFSARHEVLSSLPEELCGREIPVRIRGKQMQIDAVGNGSFSKRFGEGRPGVLRFSKGEHQRALLVYEDRDRWFAAPADVLRASSKEVVFEFLDANLDGNYFGMEDFVHEGDAAFCPLDERRLYALRDRLVQFSVREKRARHELVLKDHQRPDWSTEQQWAALGVVNTFRGWHGLAPLLLDEGRSRACALHAEYLRLNEYDYSAPWDGVGSHDEKPGNPGFTKEGLEAARRSATGPGSDPAKAITRMLSSMLHRTGYLGGVESALGVGSSSQSNKNGNGGYSVVWADGGSWSPPCLVVIPAPGVQGVPRTCSRERPAPETTTGFYDVERGFPISVTYAGMRLTAVKLRLESADTGELVPGSCFTPEAPIHSTRPANGDSAFFVAESPLDQGTRYRAVFEARQGEETLVREWVFTTGS